MGIYLFIYLHCSLLFIHSCFQHFFYSFLFIPVPVPCHCSMRSHRVMIRAFLPVPPFRVMPEIVFLSCEYNPLLVNTISLSFWNMKNHILLHFCLRINFQRSHNTFSLTRCGNQFGAESIDFSVDCSSIYLGHTAMTLGGFQRRGGG